MTDSYPDKFREECGLIAVWNVPEAANLAYLGLYAQQHRGQEGAGVVSYDQEKKLFSNHKGLGLVNDAFNNFDFSVLPGDRAIGHVRYTTAGSSTIANVQPFFSEVATGEVALAHNGNLVNASQLKKELISDGSIFRTTSDTEVILHLIAQGEPNADRAEIIFDAISKIRGAYSLNILFDDALYLVRDPAGFRPLAIGKLGDGYVAASETCAFDLIGAEYVRDVEPGEVVKITADNQIKSYFPFGVTKASPCIFEYIYFARPDSSVFAKSVYPIRKQLGAELAKESPVSADLVIPVPDSGVAAAMGYAAEAKLPFEFGLIRNHYVGRTFIEPTQSIRDFGVRIKLNPNKEILKGKRIVVVDDSIVRGTTSRKLIQMLKAAGAAEIHLRISAPPTTDPCFYGIDTPSKDKLLAANNSLAEIKEFLKVDSIAYLSIDGLYRAVGSDQGTYCDACFTGSYPVSIPGKTEAAQGELF